MLKYGGNEVLNVECYCYGEKYEVLSGKWVYLVEMCCSVSLGKIIKGIIEFKKKG